MPATSCMPCMYRNPSSSQKPVSKESSLERNLGFAKAGSPARVRGISTRIVCRSASLNLSLSLLALEAMLSTAPSSSVSATASASEAGDGAVATDAAGVAGVAGVDIMEANELPPACRTGDIADECASLSLHREGEAVAAWTGTAESGEDEERAEASADISSAGHRKAHSRAQAAHSSRSSRSCWLSTLFGRPTWRGSAPAPVAALPLKEESPAEGLPVQSPAPVPPSPAPSTTASRSPSKSPPSPPLRPVSVHPASETGTSSEAGNAAGCSESDGVNGTDVVFEAFDEALAAETGGVGGGGISASASWAAIDAQALQDLPTSMAAGFTERARAHLLSSVA
mmetsp:Transcript_101630/g.265351  ORF Transcript_101630/g.265351 Transcript_101630/m.265351 type:complete len:341 (-) Transcript_101630:2-1024(-)